jgi:hypothetical protein
VSDVTLFPPALRRCPRRPGLCWLLALSVVFAPFPQPAHSQEAQNETIHGTVINSITLDPIGHALAFSADGRLAGFTDDQGRFEFPTRRAESVPAGPGAGPILNIGSGHLMARKPGFLQSETSTSYEHQDNATGDITIALVPESLIIGRVNLASSNQFDQITVSIYRRGVRDGRPVWSPAASADTRSNGEFRVANLSAGTYKIFTNELMDRDPLTFNPRGQQYGYPPIYYPAATDFASAAAITLEAGKTFQVELSPVLKPYYPVKIAVTNVPNPGAMEISVASQGHKGPGYSLGQTDEGIEGALPSGIYTVEAKTQMGYQGSSGSVNITVRDTPLSQAAMAMFPNGAIPVRIRDERNSNNRGSVGFERLGGSLRKQVANVSLQPADEFNGAGEVYLRPPLKPNDNDLVLDNVQPGRYWLKVDSYQGYVASAGTGTVDLLRQPLTVGPGGASLPIEIVLRDDGAALEGTVEGIPPAPANARAGSAGLSQPPEGAYVYCIPLPDSPGRFAGVSVQPEGSFRFQQLAPGAYRVLAFDRQQGDLPYQDAEAMGAYEGKGPVVRLGSGQAEQVRVALISTKE